MFKTAPRLFLITILLLCLSSLACLKRPLLTHNEGEQWLEARRTQPPTIDISGLWYDSLNSRMYVSSDTYFNLGWGNCVFLQDGSTIMGTLGKHSVKGLVTGETIYLLVGQSDKIHYIALLRPSGRDRLVGSYYVDAQLRRGSPMALAGGNISWSTTPTDLQAVRPTLSTGSGFFISPDGLIVTASHVIGDHSVIRAILVDGTRLDAQIIANDQMNDIAILKVAKPTPAFLSLAPPRSMRIGQRVFTVGYPVTSILGAQPKYTEGTITSISGVRDAPSLFQISVPIQPGSSGGPLINDTGQVIGVVTSSAAVEAFLAETGALPQNVNWGVRSEYIHILIEVPGQKQEDISDRDQMIEQAIAATCYIEASE